MANTQFFKSSTTFNILLERNRSAVGAALRETGPERYRSANALKNTLFQDELSWSCPADGGGPLVQCTDSGDHSTNCFLIGILHGGKSNCEEPRTEPSMFARLDNNETRSFLAENVVCSKNYDGLTCDSCADGYYGYPNCAPCSCSSNSIPSTSCNKETGQCMCYKNFDGLKCDSCANGFHEYPFCNGIPRILVVTGNGYNQNKTELWPGSKNQCELPDFPLEVRGAVGFWTAQGPTVCGGLNIRIQGSNTTRGSNKCFIYKEHQWIPWTNMGIAREDASAIQIDQNQALIIGGWDDDEDYSSLKTIELISSSGSKEGNKFPRTIAGHCSFPINVTHAIVTGGGQYGFLYSNKTWFVDLTTTTVTPGPSMKTERGYHGCSIFQHGTKSFGIVSGGFSNRRRLDSTEVIDLDQESPKWTEGM